MRTLLGSLIAAVLLALGMATAGPGPNRLNILFIIADDLNTDLGCYGHPLVKTPNLDLLASRGIRFERAYTQAPECSPSRAALFSGLLPESIGVLDNATAWPENIDHPPYMPHFFRSRGFFTGAIGKVLHDARVPRQPFWDLQVKEWGKYPSADQIAKKGPLPSGEPDSYWARLKVKDETTADGDVARRAVAALAERSAASQPFFLAVGFRRPHAPYAVPDRYFQAYPRERIRLPRIPPGYSESLLPAARNGYPFHREAAVDALRAYYASISFMDAQVGVLMKALDRHKLWDKTVVVFTSDHGYHTGHHGQWHKQTLFEQGTRVPLIVIAPGKARGGVSTGIVQLIDLYPTLAELGGVAAPAGLDGKSFVPLLDNPQRSWEESAVSVQGRIDAEYRRTFVGRSLRTRQYRYTEWENGKLGSELYDHTRDQQEFNNLAGDSAYAETVEELREELQERLRKSKASRSRGR